MSSPTSIVPDGRMGSGEGPGEVGQSARARKRSETRERLFEASLREFREVGVAAAQIDRIAKSAGVARGTFYFHFATKDDVLIELARRISARIARRVAVLGDADPSIRDLLLRVNDAVIDELTRVGEADLLGDMLSLYTRRPMDIQDPAHNVPTLAEELTRHLQRAIERGEMKSAVPREQVAAIYMSSLFGVCSRVPQGEELRRACDGLVELLVEGLVGRA